MRAKQVVKPKPLMRAWGPAISGVKSITFLPGSLLSPSTRATACLKPTMCMRALGAGGFFTGIAGAIEKRMS
jgi:hypothetical protein